MENETKTNGVCETEEKQQQKPEEVAEAKQQQQPDEADQAEEKENKAPEEPAEEKLQKPSVIAKSQPPVPPAVANGLKKAEDPKNAIKNNATVLDVVKYPEFSEAELNDLFKLFSKHAVPPNKSGVIDLPHMKQMLQSLDLAQTHLEAKNTFEKYTNGSADLKLDNFMKMVIDLTAKNGKISLDVVLKLASQEEVDVDNVGVGGAKRFFEAKAKMLEVGDAAYRAFEDKKRQEEEQKRRQEQFKERMAKFQEQKAQ